MITFIIKHFTMLSVLSALLTQASCWLFTVTMVSLKNTYTVVTAGAACFLQTLTSTTTRNHGLAVSSHRDATSNAPLVRISPDIPSKDVRWPSWLTRHSPSVTWQPLTPSLTSQTSPLAQDSFSHFTCPEAWHTHLDLQSLCVTDWPTWKHILCRTFKSFLFQVSEWNLSHCYSCVNAMTRTENSHFLYANYFFMTTFIYILHYSTATMYEVKSQHSFTVRYLPACKHPHLPKGTHWTPSETKLASHWHPSKQLSEQING